MKNKTPRIIILTTVHQHPDVRIFFKEIPSIQKINSNLIYITQHQKEGTFIENGIQIDPLPTTESRFARFFKLQYLVYKKIVIIHPEVIHFHDPELIPLMWFVKLRFKCKIIFDIHESIADSFEVKPWIPKIVKPFLPKLYVAIENFFIKEFEIKIIVKESFKEIYGSDAKVIMNYPLINKKKDLLKDFNSNINLVYVGVIMKDRGFPQILDIYKNLIVKYKNLHFHIIGRIDTIELENQILIKIKELKLTNDITIHGVKPINEIYEILEKCHIGFSLMEPTYAYLNALTTKIFDYMANGVPYVVSDFEIYHGYVVEANTGITVNYFDSKEIEQKIKNLLNNREQLEIMSKNCIECIKEKWNWNSQEVHLQEIYKELLNMDS